MINILVTGASGFVGKELLPILKTKYQTTTVSLRNQKIEDVDLSNVQSIVHLAGKAHEMDVIDSKIYFEVNTDLTLALAEKAKLQGVQQFIFISTVKVYGDQNTLEVLNESSICYPDDPYGQSKLEAEVGLKDMESSTFKIAIIRPPLIYGKGVKGNLSRLMGLIQKVPVLPFAGINNQRSMVYVGNLIALIVHIIENQSRGIFIAGDQKNHSTTELVTLLTQHLNTNTSLIKLPSFVLSLLRILKPALVQRLFDSYTIDNSKTNEKLGFEPPFFLETGLKEMAKAYLENSN